MKFLIFADLHAHKWKRHSKPLEPDGRNDRLMDTVNVLKAIQRGIKKHEVDSVIFLGDLFHQRGEIDVETWNAVVPELKEIARLVPDRFDMLAGNHDMAVAHALLRTDNRIYISFQEVARESDKIHLHSNVTTIHSGNDDDPNYYVFLPYAEAAIAEKILPELVHNYDFGNAQVIIFTHIGIKEGVVQKGIRLRDAISGDVFAETNVKAIFSGHYHIPQKLKIGDVPFWYVGATHQHNWGDAGQDRGYMIFDSETFKVKRINLNCAPKFVVIDVTEDSIQPREKIKGNFTKAIVSAGIPVQDIANLKEQLLELGARDVVMEREKIKREKREDPPALGDTISSLGVAKSYVDRQGFKPKKAANLITLGNEILDRVST